MLAVIALVNIPSVCGGAIKSTQVGNNRYFDVVISYWEHPDGDNDGNRQASSDAQYSKQDEIEAIIQYWADGIYEMSEGVHFLRTVRIFSDDKSASACDVLWTENLSGSPFVNERALDADCKIRFADSSGIGSVLGGRPNWEKGGYTLAHEGGHRFYGLYDEHCKLNNGDLAEDKKVKCSIMNKQQLAVGRNYKYLNLSIKWQGGGRWGRPFRDWEDTKETWQHFVYKMSCWESLVYEVTTNAPGWQFWKDSAETISVFERERPFYKELQLVAPQGTNPPVINLNAGTALASLPSRAALNIIWNPKPVKAIVIDRSSSMEDGGLDDAKSAACDLINRIEKGTAVSVIAFDASVSTVHDFITITNDVERTALKNAVNGIDIGSGTAIGDAARAALNALVDYGATNGTGAVHLLTDGENNRGEDPYAVIPDYQEKHVTLYGLGYGGDADDALGQMAEETGGSFANGLASAMELKEAFIDTNAGLAGRVIAARGEADAAATAVDIPIVVDSTLTNDFRLTVNVGGSATLVLEAPDGTVHTAVAQTENDGSLTWDFWIDAPEAGTWHLTGTKQAGATLRYICDAKTHGGSYHLSIAAAEWSEEEGALGVFASLSREGSIDGAAVSVRLELTNGVVAEAACTNFSAGLYAAAFPGGGKWLFEGAKVTVTADNPDGGAVETWRGATCGASATPDVPIAENFVRVATLTVVFPRVRLTVADGAGSGRYRPGETVAISTNLPTNRFVFDHWAGDTQTVADVAAPLTAVTVTDDIAIRAVYRAVAADTIPDYMVVNLVDGAVAYAHEPPPGGWTSDPVYKTDKLVLRRVDVLDKQQFFFTTPDGGGNPVSRWLLSKLTKPFYIGVFELTQRQWKNVTGAYPTNSVYTVASDRDVHPVDGVSYADIRGLSAGAGSAVDENSFMGILRDLAGRAFDLPGEAQWNHAMSVDRDTSIDEDTRAWTLWNSGDTTHEVGMKPAGLLGLHDVTGNINEWCRDWYVQVIGTQSSTLTDFAGPSSGSARVVRGGSYDMTSLMGFGPHMGMPWRRWNAPPTNHFVTVGLRVALPLAQSAGVLNLGGQTLTANAGTLFPVAAEERAGYRFVGWDVQTSFGVSPGNEFSADAQCTLIRVPDDGEISLTPIYEALPPPAAPYSDVMYEEVPVQVKEFSVLPAADGVTVSWLVLSGQSVVEYAVLGKATLTDAQWDVLAPEGFAIEEDGAGRMSAAVPLDAVNADGQPYRFFSVWALTEQERVQ